MCNDNAAIKEDFTDSWAVCCYVFFVSLLCEGINVSNGVLMYERDRMKSTGLRSWNHLIGTAFHFIQISLAYLLMLIVMTFNIWLIMSVVLGSALGYFIIGWKKPYTIDISDHCH